MAVKLESKQLVCWRCGGTGLINHDTDRCPGCAGTGAQAQIRPAAVPEDPFQALANVKLQEHPAPSGFELSLTHAYCEIVLDELPLIRRLLGPEYERQLLAAQRPARADQPCTSCGGSGYRVYQREVPDGSGRIETVTEPCSGCGGRGRVG